jgi:hypothetical protein
MTDKNTLADSNIKGFGRCVFCDICAFEGYPYEKVVFRYTGFRSEDEDGFAYKYTINGFQSPHRIHIHRSSKQISGTSYSYSSYQQNKTSDQLLDTQLKEHQKGFDNKSCSDRICIECKTDHSFKGNFKDARTIIDLLPELFPEIFKNCSGGITKLQEFVN